MIFLLCLGRRVNFLVLLVSIRWGYCGIWWGRFWFFSVLSSCPCRGCDRGRVVLGRGLSRLLFIWMIRGVRGLFRLACLRIKRPLLLEFGFYLTSSCGLSTVLASPRSSTLVLMWSVELLVSGDLSVSTYYSFLSGSRLLFGGLRATFVWLLCGLRALWWLCSAGGLSLKFVRCLVSWLPSNGAFGRSKLFAFYVSGLPGLAFVSGLNGISGM